MSSEVSIVTSVRSSWFSLRLLMFPHIEQDAVPAENSTVNCQSPLTMPSTVAAVVAAVAKFMAA